VTIRTPDSALEPLGPRYDAILRVASYPLLGLALILYRLTQQPPLSSLLITAAIAAGVAGWIAWWVILHPEWADRRVLMAVYMAGFFAFDAVLTVRSPWFAFFNWLGYIHCMEYLTGRWRYAGILMFAGLMAIAQSGGFHDPSPSVIGTWLVLTPVNAGIVLAFARLTALSEEQNQLRKAMIEELAEANQRLENALSENSELQQRLVEQAREAGMLAERQRMAREIHDTMAQSLAGIITQLAAAGQGSAHEENARRVGTAQRLAREALAEARRSVRAVQPLALCNARLPEAVANVAANWSADSGVLAEVTTTGTTRTLHPDVEITLLRVTQEALSNVAKHACAERAWVTLSYMEGEVSLDVRDDGKGFTAPSGDGFGLTAMRTRVSDLAGDFEVESEPGAGTAVSARVPA
jgi:signal transduction histidine kinase